MNVRFRIYTVNLFFSVTLQLRTDPSAKVKVAPSARIWID